MYEKDILLRLVDTINCTGGIFYDKKGVARPFGDKTWVDLAYIYLDACAVLGQKPVLYRNRAVETK